MTEQADLQKQEAADFNAEMARLGFETSQTAEPEAVEEAAKEPEKTPEPEKKEEAPEIVDPTIGDKIKVSEFQNVAATTAALRDEIATLKSALANLQKSNDKLNGRFGEINRNMQTLRAPQAPAQQPGNSALQNVAKDFPELAEALEKDFSHLFPKSEPESESVDPAPQVNAQVEEAERRRQEMLLGLVQDVEEVHPGFLQLKETAPFKAWAVSLPPEDQHQLYNTLRPATVIKYLNQFKEHQAHLMAVDTRQRQDKTQKLAKAVMPTGGSAGGKPAAETERDEFERELKRLLRR